MIPLLGMEIDNNTLLGAGGVGILSLIGVLLALDRRAKSYIHDVVNQKPEGREILGQPVEITMHDKPMTVAAHTAVCGSLHLRVGVLESDVRAIREKMDTNQAQIIAAGEQRAKDLHRRIDGVPHQVIALLKDTKGLIE